jgi:hypothetical protein
MRHHKRRIIQLEKWIPFNDGNAWTVDKWRRWHRGELQAAPGIIELATQRRQAAAETMAIFEDEAIN